MEIAGKITQVLPIESGQGKNGEWKKQQFILETLEQYPKSICFVVWGDKIDDFNLDGNSTQEVTVSFDVSSREYNGRWYTDVKAWKLESKASTPEAAGTGTDFPSEEPFSVGESTESNPMDDLPF